MHMHVCLIDESGVDLTRHAMAYQEYNEGGWTLLTIKVNCGNRQTGSTPSSPYKGIQWLWISLNEVDKVRSHGRRSAGVCFTLNRV